MKKSKIVGSAIIGNVVEYYDFGLYAVFAPVIGELFFPKVGEGITQTLLALALFAIGFLVRPLGGIFFGHIGDKWGRKVALTISIFGMAFCTFTIGILPTYDEIGILAPLILLVVRLFQGLCVGGEGAAVAIFVLEHLEGYRPGLIGSIVMASNMVGSLLATFMALALSHFGGVVESYWRYAFILGGLVGLVGLYMRYQLNETPIFEARKQSKVISEYPLFDVIRRHWESLLVVLFLGGVTNAVTYTIRAYFPNFFSQVMMYDQVDSLYFTALGLFCMVLFLPLFGVLADKIGYRRFFYIVCNLVVLTIIPIYYMLANDEHDLSKVLVGIFLLGVLAAAICAPAYPYAIKSFEVELRFSGVASSWNVGNAVFGGTVPLISVSLTEWFGPTAPAYYLIIVCLAFMLVKYHYAHTHKE